MFNLKRFFKKKSELNGVMNKRLSDVKNKYNFLRPKLQYLKRFLIKNIYLVTMVEKKSELDLDLLYACCLYLHSNISKDELLAWRTMELKNLLQVQSSFRWEIITGLVKLHTILTQSYDMALC